MHDHFQHAAKDRLASQHVEAVSSGATDIVLLFVFQQSALIGDFGLIDPTNYSYSLRLLVLGEH